jgi:hypothetical protein
MVAYDITIVETWNSFDIERLPDFKHEALCERPGFSAVHDPCSLRAFGCRMVLCEIFRVIPIIFRVLLYPLYPIHWREWQTSDANILNR